MVTVATKKINIDNNLSSKGTFGGHEELDWKMYLFEGLNT
jgi:hypothetical protein